jgi:hypothetical protein
LFLIGALVINHQVILIRFASLFIDDTNPLERSEIKRILDKNDLHKFREYLELNGTNINKYLVLKIVTNENPQFLEILIKDFQYDINIGCESDGNTILKMVAELHHVRSVKRLLDYGARVNCNDFDNPILIASISSIYYGSMPRVYETAKLLIENGADVNAVSKSIVERTVFQEALASENHGLIELLINSGVDLTYKTSDGSNYFFFVYDSYILNLLLKNGLNINELDNDGVSPLQWFLKSSFFTVEDYKNIIDYGADLCHVDNQGGNILFYAKRRDIKYLKNPNDLPRDEDLEEIMSSDIYQFIEAEFNRECIEPG